MNVPALLTPDNGVEIFAFGEKEALFAHNGSIGNVRLKSEIMEAFYNKLHNDKEALKRIALRTNNEEQQVIEYIRCTCGDFDAMSDVDNNGGIRESNEFWECGKRGHCPDEGLVCKFPSGPSGMISAREMQVIRLIVQDYADKQIADMLRISSCTVAIHRTHIERKLQVFSKAGIAAWGASHNIL